MVDLASVIISELFVIRPRALAAGFVMSVVQTFFKTEEQSVGLIFLCWGSKEANCSCIITGMLSLQRRRARFRAGQAHPLRGWLFLALYY